MALRGSMNSYRASAFERGSGDVLVQKTYRQTKPAGGYLLTEDTRIEVRHAPKRRRVPPREEDSHATGRGVLESRWSHRGERGSTDFAEAAVRARHRTVRRATAAFFLTLAAGPARAQPATWESWGGRVADELLKLMPVPVAGLVDRHPWEAGEGPVRPWTSSGCTDGSCPWFPVMVGREWRFADPGLVKEVKALEHQAPVRKLEDVQQRMEALVGQGKYDEARKLAESMGNIEAEVAAADPSLQGQQDQGKLAERLKAEEDRASRLKEERTRTLRFRIAVNLTPFVLQEGANTKPVGAIQGRALHREPKTSTSSTRAGATLSVYLGPPGFRNGPGHDGPRMRGEVKGILVEVSSLSTRDHAQADEALARRMLERVDFAGLAKLLRP